MRIDWWTLAFQAVNALVLIWLLGHFLFRPVAEMVAARRQAATDLLGEADAAKQAAEHERELAAEQTSLLAAHRAQAFAAAETEAAAARATLVAQAHAEADALRLAATQEAADRRRAEAHNASARSIRLALEIAAKLLARLPDEARVAGFVDGLCSALEQLPAATRTALGTDQAALTVATAVPLTPAQVQQYNTALAHALGHPAAIAWRVDSTLLAGLECEALHTIVRNSLRHDLDHLTTELLRDDSPAT